MGNPETGTFANREDPDEMQHYAAFHQRLHCFLTTSGTEMHHNLEISTCEPLKYTMGSPILTVSICMGTSMRMQKVKVYTILILIGNSENNQMF